MTIVLNINSGIDRARILHWLEEEAQCIRLEDGVYQIEQCQITLEPLGSEGTPLKIPRTMVSFAGEEQCCRKYQRQFRLRFLSAGG